MSSNFCLMHFISFPKGWHYNLSNVHQVFTDFTEMGIITNKLLKSQITARLSIRQEKTEHFAHVISTHV